MKIGYKSLRVKLTQSLTVLSAGLMCFAQAPFALATVSPSHSQATRNLTPQQREIAKQQERLGSAEAEERPRKENVCGLPGFAKQRGSWDTFLHKIRRKVAYEGVGAGFSRRGPRGGIFATKWRLAAPATG